MGEKEDHLRKLSELSEKIVTLSESIRHAEKDVGSAYWKVETISSGDLSLAHRVHSSRLY